MFTNNNGKGKATAANFKPKVESAGPSLELTQAEFNLIQEGRTAQAQHDRNGPVFKTEGGPIRYEPRREERRENPYARPVVKQEDSNGQGYYPAVDEPRRSFGDSYGSSSQMVPYGREERMVPVNREQRLAPRVTADQLVTHEEAQSMIHRAVTQHMREQEREIAKFVRQEVSDSHDAMSRQMQTNLAALQETTFAQIEEVRVDAMYSYKAANDRSRANEKAIEANKTFAANFSAATATAFKGQKATNEGNMKNFGAIHTKLSQVEANELESQKHAAANDAAIQDLYDLIHGNAPGPASGPASGPAAKKGGKGSKGGK